MASRLPGSRTYREYWSNLRNGICSIRRFSEEELLTSGISPQLVRLPEYVPAHGYLDGYDNFDAAFFGYVPREAEVMDPQQRILLQCAWEALEDAGYAAHTIPGLAGVFVGVTINTYFANNVIRHPELIEVLGEQQIMLGADKDYAALRIAHKLGLRGPAFATQAACASSLVAVHVASRSLLSFECDVALAGGSSVRSPQVAGYLHVPGGTASPDGLCRAFDSRASGSVAGSGAGIVVLKRLSDAIRAGDHVKGVILATAVNNDGSDKANFVAPTIRGQVAAIKECFDFANIEPDSVAMIEAHGTGTPIGDPIEWAALSAGYPKTASSPDCVLGSAKTNIGHLDAAAGVAGLIKATLALQNRCCPQSLHYTSLNPAIDAHGSRLRVATEAVTFPQTEEPLRAGINAIGMGGVNAHVILEQAPVRNDASIKSRRIFPISAKTANSAREIARKVLEHCERESPSLSSVEYTLTEGRCHFGYRMASSANDDVSASSNLHERLKTPPRAVQEGATAAFVFPGQGTHTAKMGLSVAQEVPVVRESISGIFNLTRDITGTDLNQLVGATPELLLESRYNQLAIFAVSFALGRALMDIGIRPTVMGGHSLGEITAATLAGVFDLADAIRFVSERGQAMHDAPEGAMTAVYIDGCAIDPSDFAEDVWLAAANGSGQFTYAGRPSSIEQFESALAQKNIVCRRLAVQRAFHTPLMQDAAARVADAVSAMQLHPPNIALALSAGTADHDITTRAYWANQVLWPVRFDNIIGRLSDAAPTVVLEAGPGRTLCGLIQADGRLRSADVYPTLWPAGTEGESSAFLNALSGAWEAGLDLNWSVLRADAVPARTPLPTYAFEERRYWLSERPSSLNSNSVGEKDMMNQLRATITVLADRVIINTSGGTSGEVEGFGKAPGLQIESANIPTTAQPAKAEGIERIVREVLGFDTIDRNAQLVSLGANSLMLAKIVSNMRAQLGVDVSIADVMAAGTIEKIDNLIATCAHGPVSPDTALDTVTQATGHLPNEEIQRILSKVESLELDGAHHNSASSFTG